MAGPSRTRNRPSPIRSPRGRTASASPAHPPALAAARRDWILAVQENQRRLSARASALLRAPASSLSGQAFLDNFYAPGRPVVIEGALANWPALGRWNPEYLAAKLGSIAVEYQGGRTGKTDFELAKDRHRRTLPFDAFLAQITQGAGSGNEAYITAYNSAANTEAFAPLMEDVRPLAPWLGPEPGMLWIGPAGTFTPLHFDLTNNMLIEVTGRKHVRLVAPADTQYMYNHRHVFSAVHDLDDPARLAAHPLVRKARVYDVVLKPGEMLYIPIGWWHQVRALDFAVMLTATNFAWPNRGHESFPAD